ncbi:MAG: histidine phosphatase family protein [Hyphomicrobium sp.]|uniref:SixA phosphatase family protein n=1 Tax=Hyphomicrobium sp. CS1BSMeth3 TaxID=1892844 RepID=UPI0009314364|nr:histidine phosphatase family protein [Hyphomicrobium sp. CS1BSMeth3]MBN9262372.1 histidine phosphatase family protein [Hyphomicrobium sp.]MBN9263313.1 histidine phosphatase family protein [Hyphomicrobium sp.]
MLTLTLFRHAKSSWELTGVEDSERPLNARGMAAAPVMGSFLKKQGLKPDLVLCSTSVRTRQTLELASGDWDPEPRTKFEGALYLAEPFNMLERVRKTPGTVKHLMIVGHNPGLQIFAIELIGEGDPELITALSQKLPTAGVVVLTFESKSWKDIGPRKGRLVHFATPKMLSAAAAE